MADEGIDTDDELFEQLESELEKDGTFDFYRSQRIGQFKETIKQNNNLSNKFKYYENEDKFINESQDFPNGNYITIFTDDKFLSCQILITAVKKIIQCTDKNFVVCLIEAVNAPFLVKKLNVKILPTMIIFKKNKQKTLQIGLEGLLNDSQNIHSLNEDKLCKLMEQCYV